MMQKTIEIQCPPEIMLELHLNAEEFADLIRETSAIALFRDGRISSGMAAAWLGIPRVRFLLKAMQDQSVALLSDTDDDFCKEISSVIVFSNTTPFIALASIHQLDLLPKLFGKIHVAEAVIEECAVGGTIPLPDLHTVEWITPVPDEKETELPMLFDLDKGEKQTILLARKHSADLVLIDERIGRQVAEYVGLTLTGTLGILIKAKCLGYIPSFTHTVQEMQRQGIRYNNNLVEKLAKHIGELDAVT